MFPSIPMGMVRRVDELQTLWHPSSLGVLEALEIGVAHENSDALPVFPARNRRTRKPCVPPLQGFG